MAVYSKSFPYWSGPHVYFIEMVGHGFVKVGTTIHPVERAGAIKGWCPYPLDILAQVEGGVFAEAMVKDQFRDLRHQGEWFFLTEGLRSFIEDVARKDALPFGNLLPNPVRPATIDVPNRMLGKIGWTITMFAESLGIGKQNAAGWEKHGVPVNRLPVLIRFMAERGITVHPSDFLEDNDAAVAA
jgi:hypothetical protein